MVSNHGDHKSPNWGYSLPNGLYMGVTNHLLSGGILQVVGAPGPAGTHSISRAFIWDSYHLGAGHFISMSGCGLGSGNLTPNG